MKRNYKLDKKNVNTASLSWFKNVAKSLGYSATELLGEIVPASTDMIVSNVDFSKEVVSSIRESYENKTKISQAMNTNKYTGILKKALKNAREDLKSGNIYNKEREMSTFDDGFELDDFDMEDIENISKDPDVEKTNVTHEDTTANINRVTYNNINANLTKNNPMVKSIQKQSELMLDVAETSNKMNVALAGASIEANRAFTESSLNGTSVVNTNLTALVDFQTNTMGKYVGASLKYYEDNLKVLNATLEQLKLGIGVKPGEEKKQREELDPFLSDGGINISQYLKVVKKNATNMVDSNMILSFMKGMLSDTDTLGMLANNPLAFISKGVVKKLLPDVIRDSMKKADNSIGAFFPALLTKLNKMSDSDNYISKTIGELFGFRTKTKNKPDLQFYKRDAIPFDGETKTAITEVIPAYLRKMLAVMTGKEEKVFDYNKRQFRSAHKIKEEYNNSIKNRALSPFNEVMSEMKNRLKAFEFEKRGDSEKLSKEVENFMFALSKTNGINPNVYTKNGEVIDELSDMYSGEHKELIRQLILSLPRNMQMKMMGSDLYESKNNVRQHVEQMEKNPLLFNASTVLSGMGFDQHIKRDKDDKTKYTTKKEAKLFGVDEFKYNSLDYLRSIKEILLKGIIVYPDTSMSKKRNKSEDYTSFMTFREIQLNKFKDEKKKKTEEEARKIFRSNSKKEYTDEEKSRKLERGTQVLESVSDIDYDGRQLRDMFSNYAELHKNDESENKGPSFIAKFLKGNTQEKYQLMREKVNDILAKPAKLLASVSEKIDKTLYDLIFANDENDKGKGSAFQRIIGSFKSSFEKFTEWTKSSFFIPLKEAFIGKDGIITKFKDSQMWKKVKAGYKKGFDYLFGYKDGSPEGKRQGGLLGNMGNEFADMWASVKYQFNGAAYTNRKGESFPENPKSVLHEFRGMFSSVKEHTKKYLFGEKDKETNEYKKKGVLTHVSEGLREGFSNFSNAIFGSKKAKDGQKFGQRSMEDYKRVIKERAPKALAVGLVGAGVGTVNMFSGGLLGSLFLPGGPIGGILVGTALGFASQSSKLQNWLFGDRDADGERVGGVISKKTQDFFKENKSAIIGGATIGALKPILGFGLLPSFFLPGGPIGGAILGIGTSMLYRSKSVQKLLFGEENADGEKVGGLFNKIYDKTSKHKNLIGNVGAGVLGGAGLGLITSKMGIMGSFLLPGGPIGGAVLGAAAGIVLSSEKWKKAVFGEVDEDGKRQGGLLGKTTNWIKLNVGEPLKLKLQEVNLNIQEWFVKSIANPFRDAIDPLKQMFKNMVNDMKDMFKSGWEKFTGFLGNTFEKYVGAPFGKVMEEKVLRPLKSFFSSLINVAGKLVGGVLSAPFKGLSMMTEGLTKGHMQRGLDTMIDEGWDNIKDKKGRKERGERMGFFSTKDSEGNKVGKGFLNSMYDMYLNKENRDNARFGEKGAPYYKAEQERKKKRDEEQKAHFDKKREELQKKRDDLNRRKGFAVKYDYDDTNEKGAKVSRFYDPNHTLKVSNFSNNEIVKGEGAEKFGTSMSKDDYIVYKAKQKDKARGITRDPSYYENLVNNRGNKKESKSSTDDEEGESKSSTSTSEKKPKSSVEKQVEEAVDKKEKRTIGFKPDSENTDAYSRSRVEYAQQSRKQNESAPSASIAQGAYNNNLQMGYAQSNINGVADEINKRTIGFKPNSSEEPKVESAVKQPSPTNSTTGYKTGHLEQAHYTGSNASREDRDRPIKTQSLLQRIASDVRIIAQEVKGQLDGVGGNVYKIRKLTQKQAGVSDEDLSGSSNRDRIGIMGKLRRMLFSPFQSIKDKLVSGVAFVTEKITNVGSMIFNVGKSILSIPKKIGKFAFDIMKEVGGVLREGVSTLIKLPLEAFKLVGNLGKALAGSLVEITKMIGPAVGNILSGVTSVVSGVGSAVGKTISGIGTGLSKFASGFGKFAGDALVTIGSVTRQIATTTVDLVGGTIKTIGGFAIDITKGTLDFAMNSVTTLAKGSMNLLSTVAEKTLDIGKTVVDVVLSPFKAVSGALGSLFNKGPKEVKVVGGTLDLIKSIGGSSYKPDIEKSKEPLDVRVVKQEREGSDFIDRLKNSDIIFKIRNGKDPIDVKIVESIALNTRNAESEQTNARGASIGFNPSGMSNIASNILNMSAMNPIGFAMGGNSEGEQNVGSVSSNVSGEPKKKKKNTIGFKPSEKTENAEPAVEKSEITDDLFGKTDEKMAKYNANRSIMDDPNDVISDVKNPYRNKMTDSVFAALVSYDKRNDEQEKKKKDNEEYVKQLKENQKHVSRKTAAYQIQQLEEQARKDKANYYMDQSLYLLSQIGKSTEEHKKSWADIFGKKGLLTMMLLGLVPFAKEIIRNLKGLLEKFFGLGEKQDDSRTDADGSHIQNDNWRESLTKGGLKAWGKYGAPIAKATSEVGGKLLKSGKKVFGKYVGFREGMATAKFAGKEKITNPAQMLGSVESGASKAPKNEKLYTPLTSKIADSVKREKERIFKAINTLLDNFFNSKAVQAALKTNTGKVLSDIKSTIFKSLNDKMYMKYGGKLAKGLFKTGAKAGAAIVTVGLSDATFAAWDLVSGGHDAANIMKINSGHLDSKMRVASGIAKALVAYMPIIDIIQEIVHEQLGFSFKQYVAECIYLAIAGDEASAELDQRQLEFQAEVDKYNEEHGTTLSLNAYNDKMNKTLWGKMKSLFKGEVGINDIVNDNPYLPGSFAKVGVNFAIKNKDLIKAASKTVASKAKDIGGAVTKDVATGTKALVKKVAQTEAGKKVASAVDKAKISNIVKAGKTVVNKVKDIGSKLNPAEIMKKDADTILGKIIKLVSDFFESGTTVKAMGKAAGSVKNTIIAGFKKVFTNNVITKNMSKLSAGFLKTAAKTGADAATLGISRVLFVTWDLSTGAMEAARIFKVSEDMVDAKMRIAAAGAKSFVAFFPIIDVISEIFASITGVSLKSWLAEQIYSVLATEEEANDLEVKQGQFIEEAKEKGMSVDDYNNQQNKTVGQKIGAFVKGGPKTWVEGAKWTGGKIAEGAKWAGRKIAEGASWVGGKAAQGFEVAKNWAYDKFQQSSMGDERTKQNLGVAKDSKGNITTGMRVASGLGEGISKLTLGAFDSKDITKNLYGAGVTMKEKFDEISETIGSTMESVKEKTSEVWGNVKTWASEKWGIVSDKVGEGLDYAKEKASETWGNIKTWTGDKWNTISTKVSEGLEFAKEKASETWGNIKTWTGDKWNLVSTKVAEGLDYAKEKASETWGNVKTWTGEKWDSVSTTVNNALDKVKEKSKEVWDGLPEPVKEKATKAADFAKGAFDFVKDSFDNMTKLIKEKFSWENIKKSASEMWDGLKNGVKNFGSNIWKAIFGDTESTANSALQQQGHTLAGEGGNGPDMKISGIKPTLRETPQDGGNGPASTVNNFAYYSQLSDEYKNQPYKYSPGKKGSGPETIGRRGCGPTSMAMILTQLTKKNFDPRQIAAMAEPKYSSSSGTEWGFYDYIASKFSLNMKKSGPSSGFVKSSLGQGMPVLMSGRKKYSDSPFTKGGHYVVGVGMAGDKVLINDPRGTKYSKAYSLSNVMNEARQLWAFKYTGGPTPDPSAGAYTASGNAPNSGGAQQQAGTIDQSLSSMATMMSQAASNYVDNVFMGTDKQLDWNSVTSGGTLSSDSGSSSSGASDVENVASVTIGKIKFTPEMLNRHLQNKLANQGQTIINYGNKYKVDPGLASAIMLHESAYGKSNAIRNYNNPGGIMDPKTNWKKLKRFPSIAAGIDYTISNLYRNYIAKGLTTIPKIGAKYAPIGASNDPRGLNKHWVPTITKLYNKMASGGGNGEGGNGPDEEDTLDQLPQLEVSPRIFNINQEGGNGPDEKEVEVSNKSQDIIEMPSSYQMEIPTNSLDAVMEREMVSNGASTYNIDKLEKLVEKAVVILSTISGNTKNTSDSIKNLRTAKGGDIYLDSKSNTSMSTNSNKSKPSTVISTDPKISKSERTALDIARGRFN